jgi:hypothetical protein
LDPSATTRSKQLAKSGVVPNSKPLSADDIHKNRKKDAQRLSGGAPPASPTLTKRKAESAPTSAAPSDVKRARIDAPSTVVPNGKSKKKVRFPDSDDQMLKIRYIPSREDLAQEERDSMNDSDMDWNMTSPPQNRYPQQGSPNSPSPMNERAAEKEMFLRKREEKKRKLLEMQATTDYRLISIEGKVHTTPPHTAEFLKQREYINTHPMIMYRSPDQIPISPASPTRDQPPPSTTQTAPLATDDFLKQLMGSIDSVLSNATSNAPPPPQNMYAPPPYAQQQPPMGYQPPQQQSYQPNVPFGAVPPNRSYAPPMQQQAPPMQQQQQFRPSPQPQYPPPQFMPPQPYNMPISPHGGSNTTGFGVIRPGDPNFISGPPLNVPRFDQRESSNLTGAGSLKPTSSRIANSGKNIRCKFFSTDIGCRNGNQCQFWHDGDPIPHGGVVEFDPEIAKMLREGQHRDSRNEKRRDRDDHYRR